MTVQQDLNVYSTRRWEGCSVGVFNMFLSKQSEDSQNVSKECHFLTLSAIN